MTTDIKELVKRLRDPYRVGRGNFDVMVAEAADALEKLNRMGRQDYERAEGTFAQLVAAEAERDRLAGEVDGLKQSLIIMSNKRCDAVAERDRLKAALEAFVKHFGPLQDNAMLHEDVRNCYRLARSALEAKP